MFCTKTHEDLTVKRLANRRTTIRTYVLAESPQSFWNYANRGDKTVCFHGPEKVRR